MNKKAYMRTLEAVIAIVIIFLFITAVLPKDKKNVAEVPQDIRLLQKTILDEVENNEDYRNCAVSNNTGCLKLFLNEIIQGRVNYDFTLCSMPCSEFVELPEKTVYANSVIISANLTNRDTKLFSIYLWRKV